MSAPYHIPVLLQESVGLLAVRPGGTYVDATFGGGGHTREILAQAGPEGKVIAFDQDPDALSNLPEDSRILFIQNNFAFIETELTSRGNPQVDGILADLGISSHQIDTAERGFSFRADGPLDMRMDRRSGQPASQWLAEAEEAEIFRVLKAYGEVDNARKAAAELLRARSKGGIRSTRDLEAALRPCLPPRGQSKYLAQVFQAFRIAVNGELEALDRLLEAAPRLIRPGGRLVVIAYHSLEDRLVKHCLRTGNREDVLEKDFYGHPLTPWELITRRAVQPGEAEIAANPRARSARLRAARRNP
jgi:16S rRNA (cytosine1402-N4)-methyltransferase